MNLLALVVLLRFLFVSYGIPLHHLSRRRSLNQSVIVGGEEVHIGEYPSTAHLRIRTYDLQGYKNCGSTILAIKLLLSAANCFDDIKPIVDDIYVRIGSAFTKRGLLYFTSNFTIHPSYKPGLWQYDIVIVRMKSRMYLDTVVTRAVSLSDADSKLPDNTMVKIAGWGTIRPKIFRQSNILTVAVVPVVSQATCFEKYKLPNATKGVFCVGAMQWLSPSSCEGDNGGPVYRENRVQVGIILRSRWCGVDYKPVLCSDVRYHREWIDKMKSIYK